MVESGPSHLWPPTRNKRCDQLVLANTSGCSVNVPQKYIQKTMKFFISSQKKNTFLIRDGFQVHENVVGPFPQAQHTSTPNTLQLPGLHGISASRKSISPASTDRMENKLPTYEATPGASHDQFSAQKMINDVSIPTVEGILRSVGHQRFIATAPGPPSEAQLPPVPSAPCPGLADDMTWCSLGPGQRITNSERPPGGSDTCWIQRGKSST